ncbi:MAG TPA: AAA family ATPase [Candidatus Limnocylindrales bacterium]|nr:AAA family ATPase [Candidatus Limnocylindrales bacterium]
MRISRIRMQDVRRHERLDLELAPGITVIKGPNEAGKSTIQRAIELALFRKVTAGGQEMDAIRRWGAAADAAPTVDLEFDAEGTPGRLRKVFAGSKGRVELKLADQTITDPAAVDRKLAELTGIPTERFFQSTAAVRHQELHDLARDENQLRDRLQVAMSGATRGTYEAKRKLEEAVRRFETQGVKNPGLLKQAREAVAELEQQAARGEADLARLEQDRQQLTRVRAQRAEAEAQLAGDREGLTTAERAVELLKRQQDAQARYERYRRAAELRERIAEAEGSHPSTIALPVLRPAVERLRAMERSISELRAQLASEPDVSGYDIAIAQPRWRPFALLGVLFVVAGLLLAVGGLATPLGQTGPQVGLLLAVVGVVSILWSIRQHRLGSDVNRQNMLREAEISRRLSGRSNLEQELRDTEKSREDKLAELELADVAAAEALLEAETAHVAAIDALKAEYRGVLGDETPADDVARLRDQAAAEGEQARHALAGMGDIGADPTGWRDRYAEAVRRGQALREAAIAAEAAAQARVEQNTVDAEEVAALAERLADARERLASTERRLRIVRGALDALQAAEQATMKKAARYLERFMGSDIADITGGRYRQVRVDEGQLAFSVWSPERREWVDVSQLSYGTLDQVYLAARLGLVRQVTQDRRPPLIFDDPFVTFDDQRARGALELLRRIAADHQVIYLTCSDRYDDVADKVIELPAPTARDTEQTIAGASV